MNTHSNAGSDSRPDSPPDPQANAPAAKSPMSNTRPLYWSMRRELWENRSLYLAPLAVAGVLLFGFVISSIHHWNRIADIMPPVLASNPAQQAATIGEPYAFVAMLIILTRSSSGRSTASTRCTANAAIAASFSGSRFRCRI